MKSAALIVCALLTSVSVAVPLEGWMHRQPESQPSLYPIPAYFDASDPNGEEKEYCDKPAPDFTLRRLDGGSVHLADLIGPRPIVLIFGTFDCVYFCGRLNGLKELYEKHQNEAEFLFVYLRDDPHSQWAEQESAPADAFLSPLRKEAVRAKMQQYGLNFHGVVATDDDRVGNRYDAYPARLFIVDRTGKIAFDSNYVFYKGLDLMQAEEWLDRHCPPSPVSRAVFQRFDGRTDRY